MEDEGSITLQSIDQYAKQRPFYNSKHFKPENSIPILNADEIEESIEATPGETPIISQSSVRVSIGDLTISEDLPNFGEFYT